MFSETQKNFIQIQDIEVILKFFKQVISIDFDGLHYQVCFGDNRENSTVKFIIKNNAIESVELISVVSDEY